MVCIENCIPNSLSSQSRDLLLYCHSWQWRYINLHANLLKKTTEALKETGLLYYCADMIRLK
jgi:hypothetical protein